MVHGSRSLSESAIRTQQGAASLRLAGCGGGDIETARTDSSRGLPGRGEPTGAAGRPRVLPPAAGRALTARLPWHENLVDL